ncbi:MAG: ADOP family duplicated permease [Vicinamibacterales bacterium]
MWFDALRQDVRYAFRTLARSPGFAAVGVLVLALAIGVNTAIFSLVNALIFVKPNVPRAGELRYIEVWFANPRFGSSTMLREYNALREMHPALANAIGFGSDLTYLGEASHQRTLRGEVVTPNYFDVLEVRPQLGRAFSESDNRPDAPPVVMISDALWRSHFAGDPAILGRRLRIAPASRMYPNAREYTVIGVTPPGFRGLANRFYESHFWAPHLPRVFDQLQYDEWRDPRRAELNVDPVNRSSLQVVFRMPHAVEEAELEPVLDEAARRFRAVRKAEMRGSPEFFDQWSLRVTEHRRNRLPFDTTGRVVPTRMAAALMLAAGAVLLIAIANLAGILAARGLMRRGEMAIRTTLGAGWSRLSRQLLVESLILSAAGAVIGTALARALTTLVIAAIPNADAAWYADPFTLNVPMDGRVLGFTVFTCLIAAMLVTFAPVRQALSRDLLVGLSDGQTSASGRSRTRLRRWVIVPQVCASLVLIVIAAVLIRSVLREEAAYRGYDSSNVVVGEFYVEPSPRLAGRSSADFQAERAQMREISARLLERAETLPGVEAAALSSQFYGVPIARSGSDLVDRDKFTADPVLVGTRRMDISEDYFDVLRIPLRDGRLFDIGDNATSPKVAVVDESLAWHLGRGSSPVGKHVAFWRKDQRSAPVWMEIIGVVGSVARPLEEGARISTIYTPFSQADFAFTNGLSIRASGDPQTLARALRQTMASVSNRVTIREIRTLDESIATLYFPRRVAAGVLGTAGLAGLLLACIGLYGVVSYSVAQRVREIGIRTALGADRRDIMRMILREGARVIVLGAAFGGVLAYAAIKLTSAKVVALPQADIVTLAVAPLTLALAMMLAAYIPARRAAAVDPMIALRRL